MLGQTCASLAYAKCFMPKVSFDKNKALPIETFQSPLLPKNAIISALLSVKWSNKGSQKQKKCQTFSSKSVRAVVYRRWKLTRGSKYSELTGLNFWNFGNLVAEERWSQNRGSTVRLILIMTRQTGLSQLNEKNILFFVCASI